MVPDRHGQHVLRPSVLSRTKGLPARVDAILFDMDGVLVDVSGSYRRAICETVEKLSGHTVSDGVIQSYKNRGGFNDDWELTYAVLSDKGVDVPFERVTETFDRTYRGEAWDGLITTEPAIIHEETFKVLQETYPLALVTGRPEVEARWTLKKFDWEKYLPVVITMEIQGEKRKPDPFPLQLALEGLKESGARVEAEHVIYVGDAVDDMRAAVGLGCAAVGVIPPAIKPEDLVPHLEKAGASVVIDTVNLLPGLLDTRL